jgi:hypothetical protein
MNLKFAHLKKIKLIISKKQIKISKQKFFNFLENLRSCNAKKKKKNSNNLFLLYIFIKAMIILFYILQF